MTAGAEAPTSAHIRIRASVTRWVSEDFPGWIEVVVKDAIGRQHRIVDKVPVLTTLPITSSTTLPVECWLAGYSFTVEGDTVAVALAHEIETEEHESRLLMLSQDVVWI